MILRRKLLASFALSVLCLIPVGFAASVQGVEPAAPETGTFPFVGLVTGSGVNLRSGPGRSYEILFQLARMSKLRVLAEQGSWFAVALPEGVPAYIHRSYVGGVVEGWAPVEGKKVQVRVRPSDGATSWGALSAPERVRVLGSTGDWMKIQPPPFCRGWVHREYVTFLQKEEGASS